MTKLLCSVRYGQEAQITAVDGVDIIDVDLAALPAGEALTADDVHRLAGHGARSVWLYLGAWPTETAKLRTKLEAAASIGVDAVRVAAPPADADRATVKPVLAGVGIPVIATLFANEKPDPVILHALFDEGFDGVLLDTSDKSRLLRYNSPEQLAEFAFRAKALGMTLGFAGLLESPDVPRLLQLDPDSLGFRLDANEAASSASFADKDIVRQLRSTIPADSTAYSSPDAESGISVPTDKIFVRDFVLPVEIGAYRHEHGQTQKVRFDVTAHVERMIGVPRDMRDIVSYDLILDGIRTIVAGGHVTLAETLAEEIAALVLRHRRVRRVVVTVQKLELGASGVGVEIERERRDRPV